MVKLSDEQKQDITELYKQGVTVYGIVKQMNLPYSAVYTHTRLKERGFDSVTDYLKFLAKEKSYKNPHEYHKALLIENYKQTPHERKEFLAKQAGHKSKYDREKFWASEKGTTLSEIVKERTNKRKKGNKEITDLVKKRLEELDITRKELAQKLEVNSSTMYNYVQGRIKIPKKLLPELAKTIDINYSELERVYRE